MAATDISLLLLKLYIPRLQDSLVLHPDIPMSIAGAVLMRRLSVSFRIFHQSIVRKRERHTAPYRRALSQLPGDASFPVIARRVAYFSLSFFFFANRALSERARIAVASASVLLSSALLFCARVYLATSCTIERSIVPALGCETASCEP